jgi:hypothetical protein
VLVVGVGVVKPPPRLHEEVPPSPEKREASEKLEPDLEDEDLFKQASVLLFLLLSVPCFPAALPLVAGSTKGFRPAVPDAADGFT